MNNKKTFVTKPFLPELNEFLPYLEKIWSNGQITNNGPFHKQLETELAMFLGVQYISLVNNATIALLVAIRALNLKGEIITTPYSFVATAHSIQWNGLKPIFVDIQESDFNIDPIKIEKSITEKTSAILPVHVYGNPCNIIEIEKIAEKYNLKILYDAAHCFNVKVCGMPLVSYGDLSVLSFHATKVFNTFEGGAIISHSLEMKNKIDNLKNFGFINQTNVERVGINGKMNELQASMGLVQLKHIKKNIQKREIVANKYTIGLKDVKGITLYRISDSVVANYSYFPILVNQDYSLTRDELFNLLVSYRIYARRYFHPLITDFKAYKTGTKIKDLNVAEKISKSVICLPIYPDLEEDIIKLIIKIIKKI